MKSVVSIIPVTGSPGPGPGLLERQRQAGGLPVVHSRWTAVSDSRSPEAWHRTLLEDLVASILLHCPKPKVRLFSPGCRLFLSLYGRDGFVKDGGVFLLSLTESTNCLVAENGWCLKRKRVTAVYVQHRTGMNRQTVEIGREVCIIIHHNFKFEQGGNNLLLLNRRGLQMEAQEKEGQRGEKKGIKFY